MTKKEGQPSNKSVTEHEAESKVENSRREVLKLAGAGLAGLAGAAALGVKPGEARADAHSGTKRVCVLLDTQTHMMPALAREMAKRNHNLVVANMKAGLDSELEDLGAEVEVVPGDTDISKPGVAQSLVDAAIKRFGKVDSACIRTGLHITGNIMDITTEDAQKLYEGNLLQVVYILQALLKPMMDQGSGQIVINTSAGGIKPAEFATMYSACRAGANMLVRAAAITAGAKGVSVNATGTYAMDYPSFWGDVGGDTPEHRKQVSATTTLGRPVKPEEAAHFVASLIDGVGTGQTGQFFSIDNGWAFQ